MLRLVCSLVGLMLLSGVALAEVPPLGVEVVPVGHNLVLVKNTI